MNSGTEVNFYGCGKVNKLIPTGHPKPLLSKKMFNSIQSESIFLKFKKVNNVFEVSPRYRRSMLVSLIVSQ